MKLIFMGTPVLAVPCLDLLAREHKIVAVVTQPDKIGGRGHQLLASPVKKRAVELEILVLQPTRARDESFIEELRDLGADAMAVVAFGQILPKAILEMAPRGCINLHYSLLPRWRGAAPVQYAIWNGDPKTGVTTQWMAEKLDAGDVVEQLEVEILPHETSGELLERLTPIGAQFLGQTMRLLETGSAPRTPQDETKVTWAPQIEREMARLEWRTSAQKLENTVRAMNPWPTAFFEFRGEPIKVWRAEIEADSGGKIGEICQFKGDSLVIETGEGGLNLLEVQAPGKARMSGGAWARGARLSVGDSLNG